MKTLLQLHQDFLTDTKLVEQNLQVCHKNLVKVADTNAVLNDLSDLASAQVKLISPSQLNKSVISGCTYALKDNISTCDIVTTGGSKFLKNYRPVFNAHVYDLLLKTNAICLAKANLDEFGLGGTGTFSAYGVVSNFYDHNRIAGGSSSGCAVLVAANAVNFAIGTDTGDSIRKPATFNGIVGFKPSYGLISRFGVFPYAPSLDHVGIMTHSVIDAVIVFENLIGADNRDFTSQTLKIPFLAKNLKPFDQKQPLAVIASLCEFLAPQERISFDKTLQLLQKKGFIIKMIDFPTELLSAIDSIYKIISYSEAASCYANITGITFGLKQPGKNYEELLFNNRTFGFGEQLKRRFVIGAYATAKTNFHELLVKSQQIRRLVVEATTLIFKDYVGIIFPGASSIAPLIKDVQNKTYQTNICDDALIMANLGGFPSISLPTDKINALPVGINLMTDVKQDQLLLELALAIEKQVQYE